MDRRPRTISTFSELALWLGIVTLLMALLFVAGIENVHAQEPEQEYEPEIALYHEPPHETADLPPPGQPITLRVQLLNTTDTNLTMKTLLSRDELLVELSPDDVFLNKHDHPEYVFTTPAPLGEVAYQFLFYQGDGTPIVSERYLIRRDCLPSIEKVDVAVKSESQGEGRLNEVVIKARRLEHEVNSYYQARLIARKISDEYEKIRKLRGSE